MSGSAAHFQRDEYRRDSSHLAREWSERISHSERIYRMRRARPTHISPRDEEKKNADMVGVLIDMSSTRYILSDAICRKRCDMCLRHEGNGEPFPKTGDGSVSFEEKRASGATPHQSTSLTALACGLGHAADLTVPRTVIQHRVAASLPLKGKAWNG